MCREEGHVGFPRSYDGRGTSHPTLSAYRGRGEWQEVVCGHIALTTVPVVWGAQPLGLSLDWALQGNRTSPADQ